MFQNFILKEIHEEYVLHSVSYLSTTPARKIGKSSVEFLFPKAFYAAYNRQIIKFKEKFTHGVLDLPVRIKLLILK